MMFAKRKLHGSPSIQDFDPSSMELFSFKGHSSLMHGGGWRSEPLGNYPTLYDPSSSSSSCFTFGSVNYLPVEAQSIVNSNGKADHQAFSSSSMFNFEQGNLMLHANHHSRIDDEEECASWIDTMDQSYQLSRLTQDQNCFEMASVCGSEDGVMKDNNNVEERFALLYPSLTAIDTPQKNGSQERALQKRPYPDNDVQASKKQCSNARKTKSKPTSFKDPQSIAAKNRRERISERLKILQELVPNGTKVDLVTMLEKAISYVKFLQLQVKVLATDEFWPAQGGKAPEVSQVKEAIDAILSSYRDGNTSSKQ